MRRLSSRRLAAALVVFGCTFGAGGGVGAGIAEASVPPSAPAAVAASLEAGGDRKAALEVAWQPATDSDGTIASYVVQVGPAGAAPVAQVSTTAMMARVGGLTRGASHEVRVIAIDSSGDRSPASVPTTVAIPVLATTLRAGVRAGSGSSRSCAGVPRACTLSTTAGARLELGGTPAAALSGVRVQVTASWRKPGTRRFVTQPARAYALTAGGRSMMLGSLMRASGTWCFRSRTVDAPDLAAAAAGPTCVRLRPEIEIGWAGDIVIGSHYGLPPNGGRNQLRRMWPTLRGPDLMIGNYEGTLSRGGASRCSGGALCYIFQAPPERAVNLRTAGFDVMNLANNHGLDKGIDGRRQTVRALSRVGIASAGLPGSVTVMQVEDTRVAIVGFSPYPGTTSMRSPVAIRALVRAASAKGDIVVVAFHAGLEGAAGAHVPRGSDYGTFTRAALHTAVNAGADVVLGSGPHVVRGVERYRGTYIVYSSGNFAGWHNFGLGRLTSQSGVVRFTFDHRGRTDGGTWDGVVIDSPGVPRLDRSGTVVRRVASLSRADFGRNAARFSRGGSFR